MERALLNVALVLEAAGASFDDLVKMTAYVVDWDPSMYDELVRGGTAARAKRPYPDVALTLIGVASLFTPRDARRDRRGRGARLLTGPPMTARLPGVLD